VLYFRGTKAELAALADGAESPLMLPNNFRQRAVKGFAMTHDPIVSISYYKGHLFFVERPGDSWHTNMQVNNPWGVAGGSYTVLAPVPPRKEGKP
jgi:hypothetical protein